MAVKVVVLPLSLDPVMVKPGQVDPSETGTIGPSRVTDTLKGLPSA